MLRVVAPGIHNCCPCEEHWTNFVGVTYASDRLSVVGEDGLPFRMTEESCTIYVAGTRPSDNYGEARLVLNRNGIVDLQYDMTVFGVAIEKTKGVPIGLRSEIAARLERMASSGEAMHLSPGERELAAIIKARDILRPFAEAARRAGSPLDLVIAANAVRDTAEKLGALIGATYSEDLLESLFSRFCVGK